MFQAKQRRECGSHGEQTDMQSITWTFSLLASIGSASVLTR